MKRKLIYCLIIFALFSGCVDKEQNGDADIKTRTIENDEFQMLEAEAPKLEINDIESCFKDFLPDFTLLAYFSCNFSSDYDKEYIAFYTNPSKVKSFGAPKDIDKIIVFFIKENLIVDSVSIKAASLGYNEEELALIKQDSKKYGYWNGYCYLFDSDNNGYEELYFYGVSGMSFGLLKYEYVVNKFELVEYVDYMGK